MMVNGVSYASITTIQEKAMKNHPIFKEFQYKTPNDTKRSIYDRLMLGGPLYFHYSFIKEILDMRKKALAGVFHGSQYGYSSHKVLKAIEKCGGKFQIENMQNILKAQGPVVFVANHMSTTESMVLPSIIQPLKDVTFVVKQSLIDSWVFGPVMKATLPVAVDRNDPRKDLQKVLNEGSKKLSNGTSVIVFPEGTRQTSFKRENFNTLGIKLAKKAGVQVIPIALKTDFWGQNRITKEWASIHRDRILHFAIGEPISIEGNGKAAHEQVLDFIEGKQKEWKINKNPNYRSSKKQSIHSTPIVQIQ